MLLRDLLDMARPERMLVVRERSLSSRVRCCLRLLSMERRFLGLLRSYMCVWRDEC